MKKSQLYFWSIPIVGAICFLLDFLIDTHYNLSGFAMSLFFGPLIAKYFIGTIAYRIVLKKMGHRKATDFAGEIAWAAMINHTISCVIFFFFV